MQNPLLFNHNLNFLYSLEIKMSYYSVVMLLQKKFLQVFCEYKGNNQHREAILKNNILFDTSNFAMYFFMEIKFF